MTVRPLTYFWYKCDRATFRDENSHAVIDKSRTGIVANTIMPSVSSSLSLSWSPLPLDILLLKNLLIDIVLFFLTPMRLFYPGSLWILDLGLYFMFYMACCIVLISSNFAESMTLGINSIIKLFNSDWLVKNCRSQVFVFSFLSQHICIHTLTHTRSR